MANTKLQQEDMQFLMTAHEIIIPQGCFMPPLVFHKFIIRTQIHSE